MAKRAILFVNGDVEQYEFLESLITSKDYLVAVDGGLRHLEILARQPHLLIGDLDSITTSQLKLMTYKKVEICKFPVEKNETDLELALLEVVKRGFEEILIIGALGGRLDQTLANLFLLLLPELSGKSVRLLTHNEEILLVTKKVVITGNPGDVISLIPLKGDAVGVTTGGLKFPLRGETLFAEHSRGISNSLLSLRAEIEVIGGSLLLIHSQNKIEENL